MRFDKYVMAQMNKKMILEMIFEKGPINRAEIARLSGLSVPTVMKITDEFSHSNLIRGVGKRESTGGRQPELLEINKDAYCCLGLDVGRNRIKVAVMNLAGEIGIKKTILTGDTLPPEVLIYRMISLVREVLDEMGNQRSRLLGIGIGMPGLLDPDTGMVNFSPDFGWEHVDLLGRFKHEFSCHIVIENANRVMALGERWFGAGRNADNFLCVNLGHGIGSALVFGGEVYHGNSGTSGEIGHITLEKDGPLCECGNHGCLEALASGRAIARQAGDLAAKGKGRRILELAGGKPENIEAETVFAAAREGDREAVKLLDLAIGYLGIAAASVVNLFDPELIIFEGGLMKSSDYLLPRLKTEIRRHQMRLAGRNVQIRRGDLGEDITAVGAATLLMQNLVDSGGVVEINVSLNQPYKETLTVFADLKE